MSIYKVSDLYPFGTGDDVYFQYKGNAIRYAKELAVSYCWQGALNRNPIKVVEEIEEEGYSPNLVLVVEIKLEDED